MLIAMLDQETGLRGYVNTHDQRFLEPYRNGRTRLETAPRTARCTRPRTQAATAWRS
jgi:CHASE3 domain sensor protein